MAMHARVTFAAHDMNAFAELGQITVAQWHAAPTGPDTVSKDNSIILDLMRGEYDMVDEKFVTPETAGVLLGWPAEQVVSRGRQAVAQGLDEDAEYLRSRRRDVYRRIAAES